MVDLSVLIVGAGIAGPVQAYWLARGGARVTVVERSPTKPHAGQGIDVEGAGRVIAQRMGIVDELKARSTKEAGLTLVDSNNRPLATLPGGGAGLTQEIEILRSDMADILTKAAEKRGVEFHYGRTITAISQTPKKVMVTFDDSSQSEYDAVIGADGIRSKTRSFIMEPGDYLKRKDLFVAFYRVPCVDGDDSYARWQHAPGGRSLTMRPGKNGTNSAYLAASTTAQVLEDAVGKDRDVQKAALKGIFGGIGGIAPRLLAAMDDTDDFYFERISQIKLPKWSQGRCALVGDAGYAPSPLTGEGTRLALIGAYVCAGELLRNPRDPEAAFREYERKCRGNVEESQKIPLWEQAPKIANPQWVMGIWLVRIIFCFVAWTGISKLLPGRSDDAFKLPDYPEMYDEQEEKLD